MASWCGGSHVWDTLVSYASDLYPAELLLDDIERAYKEGLVDPVYIGFDDVKRDAMGKDRTLARLADNPHRRLVDDAVAEMGWWACCREGARNGANNPDEDSAPFKLKPEAASSIIRVTP